MRSRLHTALVYFGLADDPQLDAELRAAPINGWRLAAVAVAGCLCGGIALGGLWLIGVSWRTAFALVAVLIVGSHVAIAVSRVRACKSPEVGTVRVEMRELYGDLFLTTVSTAAALEIASEALDFKTPLWVAVPLALVWVAAGLLWAWAALKTRHAASPLERRDAIKGWFIVIALVALLPLGALIGFWDW